MQQHNNGLGKVKEQSKVSPPSTQKETILKYFQTNIATVRMCEQALGISSQTICGYKAQLLDDEKLIELYKKPCKISGKSAWYYSANPKNLPQ